jgi:hypothetical protein
MKSARRIASDKLLMVARLQDAMVMCVQALVETVGILFTRIAKAEPDLQRHAPPSGQVSSRGLRLEILTLGPYKEN